MFRASTRQFLSQSIKVALRRFHTPSVAAAKQTSDARHLQYALAPVSGPARRRRVRRAPVHNGYGIRSTWY